MAASLSLQTCLASVCIAPQKLHLDLSSQGLQRWPGASATAPQFLHVYAIGCSLFLWVKKSRVANDVNMGLR
jgi:hypothetical protein